MTVYQLTPAGTDGGAGCARALLTTGLVLFTRLSLAGGPSAWAAAGPRRNPRPGREFWSAGRRNFHGRDDEASSFRVGLRRPTPIGALSIRRAALGPAVVGAVWRHPGGIPPGGHLRPPSTRSTWPAAPASICCSTGASRRRRRHDVDGLLLRSGSCCRGAPSANWATTRTSDLTGHCRRRGGRGRFGGRIEERSMPAGEEGFGTARCRPASRRSARAARRS